MHGNANRARLVGNCAANRLANPPSGIGAEFEAERMIELVDRANQTDIALLNQVQKVEPATDVALGHTDHQTQVALGQAVMGTLGNPNLLLQFELLILIGDRFNLIERARHAGRKCDLTINRTDNCLDPFQWFNAIFDLLRQFEFFFGHEQRVTTDLTQVDAYGIKRLADLWDIGDELFDGDILFTLDLFFELGITLDPRDRCGILILLVILARDIVENVLFFLFLPQINILI